MARNSLLQLAANFHVSFYLLKRMSFLLERTIWKEETIKVKCCSGGGKTLLLISPETPRQHIELRHHKQFPNTQRWHFITRKWKGICHLLAKNTLKLFFWDGTAFICAQSKSHAQLPLMPAQDQMIIIQRSNFILPLGTSFSFTSKQ